MDRWNISISGYDKLNIEQKIKYKIYIHPSKSIAIDNVKLLLVVITFAKWIIKKIHK